MAELAIGAVSFTFQAFAGCIQAYELISDACHARKEYETLLIKLKVEEHRLLDWGRSVGIDFTDDQLLLNHMSKGLIMGILEQQQKLLVSFGKLDKSYRALEKPDLVETEVVFNFSSDRLLEGGDDKAIQFPNTDELVNKVRIFTDKLKVAPKKLRWAIDGREKMTALVNNLIYFNDKLHEVLDKHQRDSLFELQTRTNYQIVLLNQNVKNLMQIIQAQRITTQASHLALPNSQGYGARSFNEQATTPNFETGQLVGLAQFKAINLQIEGSNRLDDIDDTFARQIDLNHSASDIRQTKIELNKISEDGFSDDLDPDVRTLWQYEGRNVWIEWKDDELNYARANGAISTTHERISKLAALLKEMNKTVRFRAPECLGYFEDEDNGRFGFVFAKPPSIPADEAPTTLRELLTGNMPPLADRITLMRLVSETVERLHAVNWLHKGLQSANILFFKRPTGDINFANPYISGFEYSRPATREDMTQRPSDDLAADLYRHPKTQSGSHSAGFLKSFDLYSLGVVLLEIAYWQPIEDILGINMNEVRPRHTEAVRRRLLAQEERFQSHVRAHLGVAVESVIWACLKGPSGFGLAEECDERDASVGATLQWEFGERVVKKLALMKGL
ncbi:hypothetical protein SVAN01_08440 [Stagonosporopsis vannaccii]|nr:hypothetical protein SVAN01_08440 [Stagonosporopsis vannaccii]